MPPSKHWQTKKSGGTRLLGRTSPCTGPEAPYDSGGAGRRQLPTGRSGPAFFAAHAIVEEDEGKKKSNVNRSFYYFHFPFFEPVAYVIRPS